MSEPPKKEELKLKDLAIKLKILTDALKEERQKTKTYLDKINSIQKMISNKENEIVSLNQDIFEIQSQLSLERQPVRKNSKEININKVVNKFFNKQNINFDVFDQLKEENSVLLFQNKQLLKTCLEEHEALDQQKSKFDTMITLQKIDIENLEKKMNTLKEEKNEVIKKNCNIDEILNNLDVEGDYKKSKKEKDDKIESNENLAAKYNIDIAMINMEIKNKNDKIASLQKTIKEQNNALNALKNSLSHKVLEDIDFTVEKIDEDSLIKKKKEVKVMFKRSQKYKTYLLIMQSDNKGTKETESVKFLKVLDFEIKDEKKFEFRYIVT